MNQNIELKLIEECRSNRDNKTTSLVEKGQISDASRYLSEERLQQEIDKVYGALPSLLVHASELPDPNSFVSVESAIGPFIAPVMPMASPMCFATAAAIAAQESLMVLDVTNV